MDFTLHKDADRVDFRYSIREDKSGELMTPRIQYVFLELPNSLGRALTPQASVLDNICYAFHEMEHLTERRQNSSRKSSNSCSIRQNWLILQPTKEHNTNSI